MEYTAILRIWMDHPLNNANQQNLQVQAATAQKIVRIMTGLLRDGWVGEEDSREETEICWELSVAFHEDDPDEAYHEAIRRCEKRNPKHWGSLVLYPSGEEEIQIW